MVHQGVSIGELDGASDGDFVGILEGDVKG